MTEVAEIIVRSITAFLFLMILAYMIGKQMIGQMSYHHFVAAITFGSIAGNTAFNIKIKFIYFILSLFIFSLITLGFTYVSIKSRKARKWITGEPAVLIEDGKIAEHTMEKLCFSIDLLNQGLRKKDVFDLNEVQYAVLERDGSLSVLKKPDFRSVTKKDLSVKASPAASLPVELIREGNILEPNLVQIQQSKKWLLEEVSKRGYELSDVFYAVQGTDGRLFLDLYRDHPS